MTAVTTSRNHQIQGRLLAEDKWKRMDKLAFPSSVDGPQDNGVNSHHQPQFLSLSDSQEFDDTSVPRTSNPDKAKRWLTGESTITCTLWRKHEYTCDPPGLHEEICDFCEYIKPRPTEFRMRQEVVWRVTSIIQKKWPRARIEVFGSSCTGLFLPTSDIDLVVFGSWAKLPLFSLEEEFLKAGIAREGSILVLDKTTVPIIKFIDKISEVKVDISFNHDSGLKSAAVICQFIQQYPALSKLVLVLKQFLTQRGLNEVYYGGIGSYSLTLLLVSFLQLHPRNAATEPNANLGVLLIEFFELYGRHFNYMRTGISVLDNGSYFPKEEDMQDFLYIKDPINLTDNASRGCFGMWQVKQAFDHAFLKLHCTVISRDNPIPKRESLLSSIVQISKEVVDYREWVDGCWPAPLMSSPASYHSVLVPVLASGVSPYIQQYPYGVPPFPPSPVAGVASSLIRIALPSQPTSSGGAGGSNIPTQ